MSARPMRRTVALLGLVFGGCNLFGSGTTDPSITNECWSHPSSAVGGTCSAGDEHEPNDTTSAANPIVSTPCEMQTISGKVAGDADVFKASGKRCKGLLPSATLTTSDHDVRLCMFMTCKTGKAALRACGTPPTAPTHMPEGMLGCCRTGEGPLTVDVACDADNAPVVGFPPVNVYLVVDRTSGDACASYDVKYVY